MNIDLNDITVAITTYKRPGALATTLEALEGLPNVHVVLNGSDSDEYRDVLAKHIGRVTWTQNLVNIGAGAAANRLIMECDTRYVVLSTDSCRYTDEWWQPLLDLLNTDDPPQQVSLSSPNRFTAWCIDKHLVGQQGFYDHNFTQVYYEDEDWYLRTLERLELQEQDVSLTDVMPVLSVVKSNPGSKGSWNSIPNRLYFWQKWERVDESVPGHLMLRDDVMVRRRRSEPMFPYLDFVQNRYRTGDYSSVPFVYDLPSKRQRWLTRLTSNPVVTRARFIASRVTNPTGRLK